MSISGADNSASTLRPATSSHRFASNIKTFEDGVASLVKESSMGQKAASISRKYKKSESA